MRMRSRSFQRAGRREGIVAEQERCPTCGSDERNYRGCSHCGGRRGQMGEHLAVRCTDPWHDQPAVPGDSLEQPWDNVSDSLEQPDPRPDVPSKQGDAPRPQQKERLPNRETNRKTAAFPQGRKKWMIEHPSKQGDAITCAMCGSAMQKEELGWYCNSCQPKRYTPTHGAAEETSAAQIDSCADCEFESAVHASHEHKAVDWRKMCIIEIACENQSVRDYVEHWKGRTLKAESDAASLREELAHTHDELHSASLRFEAQQIKLETVQDALAASERRVEELREALRKLVSVLNSVSEIDDNVFY